MNTHIWTQGHLKSYNNALWILYIPPMFSQIVQSTTNWNASCNQYSRLKNDLQSTCGYLVHHMKDKRRNVFVSISLVAVVHFKLFTSFLAMHNAFHKCALGATAPHEQAGPFPPLRSVPCTAVQNAQPYWNWVCYSAAALVYKGIANSSSNWP